MLFVVVVFAAADRLVTGGVGCFAMAARRGEDPAIFGGQLADVMVAADVTTQIFLLSPMLACFNSFFYPRRNYWGVKMVIESHPPPNGPAHSKPMVTLETK